MIASDAAKQEEFKAEVAAIIARNRVVPEVAPGDSVVASINLDEAMKPTAYRPVLSFDTRIRTSLGTGGIAAVVGAAVAGKLAAKGVIKTAAKALTKVVGERAVSVAAGTALGGLIGSVIPFIGTGIGAAFGGIVAGVVVSAGADYLLLKLEEQFGRDTHRAEILSAIDEMRQEFMDALSVAPPPLP